MAKKGRHRKGGRVTPKGTRPIGFRPIEHSSPSASADPEPDLMRDVRRAVGTGHPLDLLVFASSLLAVVDERRSSPLERSSTFRSGLSRAELMHTFIETTDRRHRPCSPRSQR